MTIKVKYFILHMYP